MRRQVADGFVELRGVHAVGDLHLKNESNRGDGAIVFLAVDNFRLVLSGELLAVNQKADTFAVETLDRLVCSRVKL